MSRCGNRVRCSDIVYPNTCFHKLLLLKSLLLIRVLIGHLFRFKKRCILISCRMPTNRNMINTNLYGKGGVECLLRENVVHVDMVVNPLH